MSCSEDDDTTEPRIVNVVATANLGQRLNLETLAKSGLIFHDEAVYGGRVGYFRSPSFPGGVTLFPSGKMIGVGTRSEEEAFRQLEYVEEALAEHDIIESVPLKPKIQNIVATLDLKSGIDVEGLAHELNLDFEPEQFPGAIMRLHSPCQVTILVFASGKAVITGAKTYHEVRVAAEELMKATMPFRK